MAEKTAVRSLLTRMGISTPPEGDDSEGLDSFSAVVPPSGAYVKGLAPGAELNPDIQKRVYEPKGLTPGNQPPETIIPRVKAAAGDWLRDMILSGAGRTAESETGSLRGAEPIVPVKDPGERYEGPPPSVKDLGVSALAGAYGMAPEKISGASERGDVAGALTHAGLGILTGLAMSKGSGAMEGPRRLAAENPEVAAQIAEHHLTSGGFTVDPRTGQHMSGARLWSVGIAPEATMVLDHTPTAEEISGFAGTHRDLFNTHPNSHVGGWYDPETGLHHVDIVGVTPSKNAAMNMATSLGEKGIYHLGREEYVPTGHEGDRPVPVQAFSERFGQLHSESPMPAPYSGVHFSNQPLTTIEGSRRGIQPGSSPGSRPVGAEANRLRMGTQSGGKGPDAPPGFYTYNAGTLPEEMIGSRKYAHSVKGNFAFADISKDPAWSDAVESARQSALEKGASPAEAQALGLNAGEHALRDAGYDGYYHPDHPNVRFIFDSHPTEVMANKPKLERRASVRTSPTMETISRETHPMMQEAERRQRGRIAELEKKYPVKPGSLAMEPLPAESQWPGNYQPAEMSSEGGGGANYTAAELAEFKKRHGIK